MDENPVPTWQRVLAGAYALGIVAVLVVFHSRLSTDLWPPDRSTVAPNLLASVIVATVLTIVAVLLWPPTRRRLHRFVDHKLSPLHHRVAELHGRHDEHAASLAALHQKLDALTETQEKP